MAAKGANRTDVTMPHGREARGAARNRGPALGRQANAGATTTAEWRGWMRELTLVELRRMMAAANEKAKEFGTPSSVVIVDVGGHIRAAERPEDGRFTNLDIAFKKAWTSIGFKRPTDMVRQIMMPDQFGYGLQHTDARYCMVAGGYPIVENGEFLGGIGVSAGPVDEDSAICLAALEACGFATEFMSPLTKPNASR